MSRSWQVVCVVFLGGWAALWAGRASAESGADATPLRVRTTRDYWEQQVLRRSQPGRVLPVAGQAAPQWSPDRPAWAPVQTVAGQVQPAPPVPAVPEGELVPDTIEAIPDGEPLSPVPSDEAYYPPGGPAPGGAGPETACPTCGGYYDDCTCGGYYAPSTCGQCFDACHSGGCYGGRCTFDCAWRGWWRRHCWWVRNLSLFAGVHGFKGPADRGLNGNFGFHEGLNWGAPLGGPFGVGYQVGAQVAHSNFSGDQTASSIRTADRNQLFLTAGIFRRRPCGGLQWGVAFDWLHDDYHGEADLRQIRNETALVFSGCREIGFWGAYGVGGDDFTFQGARQRLTRPFEPNDTYSLFYRRHFSGGGNGRFWAGLSGSGDALIGADCTIALGTSWALENNFVYLIPDEGSGAGGQQEETWSVSFQLVWYPGREAACAIGDRYHPLFNVADNSRFLLRTE